MRPSPHIRALLSWSAPLLAATLMWAGASGAAEETGAGEPPSEALTHRVTALPNVHFGGTNTLRYDHFDADGPESPYPFEGNQVFDEFNVNFRNPDGPYSQWRGQLSGVLLNKRGYRAPDRGFVPERMNLTREAGDRKFGDRTIPYRWQVGDYFSHTSILTQQRSVKGVQMEVQPRIAGNADSLQLFMGSNEGNWQTIFEEDVFADDISSGATYVFETDRYGTWHVDGIYNHREGDDLFFPEDRDQGVVSAAVFKEFEWGDQALSIELEEALAFGDLGAETGEVGNGFLAEVSGRHTDLPLTYRARGEVYDRHYTPRGAIVSSNRASGEGHASWQFENGVQMRGRVQGFADGFQKADQTDTVIGGVNVSGPIGLHLLPSVKGSSDFFIQHRENESETVESLSINWNGDLSSEVGWGWLGRLGWVVRDDNDKTAANADSTTVEVSTSADHDFSLGPFDGVVTPGFLMRFIVDGTPDSDEFQPTLAVRAGARGHSVGFNYGALIQERESGAGATDFKRHTITADYTVEVGRNRFGTEFEYLGLDRKPGEDTDAWNLGIFWTFTFDRPGRPIAPGHPAFLERPSAEVTQPLVAANIKAGDPGEIAPGLPLAETRKRLTQIGIVGGVAQTDLDVYETPVLRRIDQRQRLVVIHDDETVLASALIIELDDAGAIETAGQRFERVREELIKRYGPPVRGLERGQFGATLLRDVNTDQLIRIVEWDLPHGVLRFGIPRRYDGQVRMELQHRQSFPPPAETHWSIEAVR